MYYKEKYGNLTVADVMEKLQDDNWHTENVLLEALVKQDHQSVIELCEIILECDKVNYLPNELNDKVIEITKRLR